MRDDDGRRPAVSAGSTVSADSESVDGSTSAKRTDRPALEMAVEA